MLLVDRLEQRTLADRQVAATFIAAGAKKAKMPDVDEVRALFDRQLAAEPKIQPRGRQALLEALGVQRAG